MRKFTKPVLIIVITTGLLFMSLGVVQARLFRGGNDTFYEIFNVCQDGVEFNMMIDSAVRPSVDASGTLLSTGATVVTDTFLLENVPVQIPGVGWVDWSANVTLNWSTSLLPGSRVRLLLLTSDEGVPLVMTVQDCSLVDSPAAIESNIIPDPIGNEYVPPDGLPFPGTSPACISSTIQVNLDQPVGDLNLSMYLDIWDTDIDQTPITGTLTSPAGTTVVLMDGVNGGRDGFGTRCKDLRNDLLYDPMADFILDDDSVFQFPDLTAPFAGTAVHPSEALKTFRGENAAGTWTLDICNHAPIPEGGLECWYMEFAEAGMVSGHLFIDTNGDGDQDTGEPDLTNVDVIVSDSRNQVQIGTSDGNGDWSVAVPPGSTTATADSSDPDFPAGYIQTGGTNPMPVNAVTGTDVFTGNDGFFQPIEIFLPLLTG